MTRDWLGARALPARDAIVLLPFAQLLAPARAAFAAAGGWMPRIETSQTLAEAGFPGTRHRAAGPGPSGETALDRLIMADMLQGQSWARDWSRRDAPGFAHAVAAATDAASVLNKAAAGLDPQQRESWWQQARSAAVLHGGAGDSMQCALLRVAVEWAASADDPATDALFDLRPAAWIVVQAGGAEPLVSALLERGARQGVVGLLLDIDGESQDPLAQPMQSVAPSRVRCADGEDEAMAAAAAVIDSVNDGAVPVALIAEDRVLARRVRALLDRAGLAVDDETGWALATTRAAAHLMSLLRAASPQARPDDWLAWLKNDLSAGSDRQALLILESAWRRGQGALPEAAAALWQRERVRLSPLLASAARPLAHWLGELRAVLNSGSWPVLWHDDGAGRQVRAVLRLDEPEASASAAWARVAALPMNWQQFSQWVATALEHANFVPAGADAPVTITPLARAMLRPFASVVMPGTDEQRLGRAAPFNGLIGNAMLRALGLPDRQAQWRRRAQCLAAVLRAPRVILLRRLAEGDEPLAPSPLVERLVRGRARAGLALKGETAARWPMQGVQPAPQHPPAPTVGAALPKVLSASQVQALRDCPYRFFARAVLGLRESEEIDADPDKRDYGNWLHASLLRWHRERVDDPAAPLDAARLAQLAEAVLVEQGLDPAAMLPFRADLGGWAARYLDWQARQERAGWRFRAGELELSVHADALEGVALKGVIDRIDDGSGQAVRLLDYKTGRSENLRQRRGEPLEYIQLAFYAALIADQLRPGQTLEAAYLSLDDSDAVDSFDIPGVAEHARDLVQALAQELHRMRGGAALRALGQPPECDFCEMRGLCRRDHWLGEEGTS